ncbi:MAG: YtxH domain-containing protein [Chlamydiales bacterium]
MLGKRKHTGSSFFLGAVIGGLFGGAAVLLLTPKSGKEMQKELIHHYGKVSHDTVQLLDGIRSQSLEMLEKAKTISKEANEIVNHYLEDK